MVENKKEKLGKSEELEVEERQAGHKGVGKDSEADREDEG